MSNWLNVSKKEGHARIDADEVIGYSYNNLAQGRHNSTLFLSGGQKIRNCNLREEQVKRIEQWEAEDE